MAKVTMPQLGESVAEGTVGRWLKKPGDRVELGEPIVEVITDKVNAEIPSPFAGVVTAILAEEGVTVPCGTEIAIVETADGVEVVPPGSPSPSAAQSAAPSISSAVQAPAQPATPPVATIVQEPAGPELRMTPAVRRLLRERGIAASAIVGTGVGGRITRDDVLAFEPGSRPGADRAAAPAGAAPASSAPGPGPAPTVTWAPGVDEEVVPLTTMRRGIAAQMTRATQVPHAYLTAEIDMTPIVLLRESRMAEFRAREGAALSFVPFVIKATVEGLRRYPDLNAHWTEQGLVRKRRLNVGVAVAVDDGLIVPVVQDADLLSIVGLNRAIADLAARARAGRLRLDDLRGGTVTVDNAGSFGSVLTLPILNVPEILIVTMEAIVKRPVVRETPEGDVIAVRSMMHMVAGFDHRATDGAQVGRFLRVVKAWLETVGPETPLS